MLLLKLLKRLFHGPAWLNFICMGLATGAFGLCSYNLFDMSQANSRIIEMYNSMEAFDDGLVQFFELAFWGYLGLACYVVFKGCSDGLPIRIHRARPDGIA